jgi:cytochrome P450/NADPH-cytochrome P450 reductase
MLAKLRNLGPQTAINISEYMYRLTSDIIFLCAFNYKPNSFSKDEANELTQIISHVFHDITTTFLIPKFIKKNMFMMHQRHKKSLKYLDNYVNQVLQERISNPEKNTNTKDLLNLMLQNKDRFGQTLDMQNIHEQIITFLVAGSHTSDILLSSAVYYLGRHPQILAKAYEEIDSVYGPEQVLKPSLVQLSKLGYISRILDECLRLHPPVPLIHYYAREDTVFLGKYTVKKEDVIFLSLDNLHREPSVWGDNADSFDPDRFLPEYVAKRDPNTYKPFGSGLRACIGKQFAQQESILTLSMLLHRYKIHLNDKTTDPEHVFVTVEQRTDDERRINSGNTATNL